MVGPGLLTGVVPTDEMVTLHGVCVYSWTCCRAKSPVRPSVSVWRIEMNKTLLSFHYFIKVGFGVDPLCHSPWLVFDNCDTNIHCFTGSHTKDIHVYALHCFVC